MIGIHYQDPSQLAEVLLSLARACEELDSRLWFMGSEAACEEARSALHGLDVLAPASLAFRPLPQSRRGRREAVEALRTALHETLTLAEPAGVWVDLPAPREGSPPGPALRDYCRVLDTAPASATVLCAYRPGDLSEGARASLVECCDSVLKARILVPRCPSWLFSRGGAQGRGHAPGGGAPPPGADADLQLATKEQTEKLAVLGQLATGVAHELGNPLSIISSSLQYLHQRLAAASDPASDFTSTALANVERMHGLLRGMLDFAAVKKSSFQRVDLNDIISEVLRFTAAECQRRNIAVEVSFESALPRAWVEPPAIKQVVLNLVKNGLDALAQSGDRLDVRTRLDASNETAVVEVANNGPAIPPEVLARIFRPFQTTKDGGTGLGLYLSRQIAKEHQGALDAQNLPEGGVRFTLTLPLDRRRGGDGANLDRRR